MLSAASRSLICPAATAAPSCYCRSLLGIVLNRLIATARRIRHDKRLAETALDTYDNKYLLEAHDDGTASKHRDYIQVRVGPSRDLERNRARGVSARDLSGSLSNDGGLQYRTRYPRSPVHGV